MKISVTLILIILLTSSVLAQDKTDIEDDYQAKENNWRFIISPYAFLAGQATDVGGEKIRQSFNDLTSLTNFGFQLYTVIMYKKWLLSADGTYANLGSTIDEGLLQVDLDIKQYMLDLRLGYLVYMDIDLQDEDNVVRGWALEVNAGAKYWENDVKVDYKIQVGDQPPLVEGSLKEPQAWWDMMIGAKARIFLSRSVLLGITASGGGFGIGNSSNFSYDFFYANTFKISDLISVTAGYRTFKYTRVDGEGDERIETKVSVFGPLLGVSFVF
jgi:hypothetical protein